MPNWCENQVIIEGNADELKELFTLARKTPEDFDDSMEVKFLMDNLVPMPPELLENGDWYEWRLENWGTKWDLSQEYDETRVYYEEGDTMADLDYQTAWAPNCDFWITVSERFPSLKIDIRYIEEGMWFMGHEIYQNGRILDRVYHNNIPDEVVKDCGEVVFDAEGNVDWDNSEFSLWEAFPLIKEAELV